MMKRSDGIIAHHREKFPRKIHPLLEFGFKSLSLQRIASLNTNARSTIANPHTAESKAYRLTKNKRFVPLFPRLIVHLGLVHEDDIIAVDFSDFGIIQVLMFGKQTRTGRTLPLYFKIIIYPIQEGSENIFLTFPILDFSEDGCGFPHATP